MYKAISIAFTVFLGCSHAQSAPVDKDERDVLKSARVYHIMGGSPVPLEKLRAQLRDVPEDQLLDAFKRLASAESSDAGSAPLGGDLGLIVEGAMDEKFDTAVFSQRPMQVSAPQQSAFGWHLLLVTLATQEPVLDVCQRSLSQVQAVMPIEPIDLFQFSLAPQSAESMHPAVLRYLGHGWGPAMNWNGDLAYMRGETDSSKPNLARLVLHTEKAFARYTSSPSACARSARHTFAVDCSAIAVALVSHVEYEGRAATGRRLVEVEYSGTRQTFEPANSGFLAQVAQFACGGSRP